MNSRMIKEFEELVGFYKNANIPEYSQECRRGALFCRDEDAMEMVVLLVVVFT